MADEMVATGKKTQYPDNLLFGRGGERVFSGKSLKHCAMPLGPMGCGSISLGGRGQLCHWRMLGQTMGPERLPRTFFAVRAKSGGGKPVSKVLQLDRVSGLPLVKDIEFVGEFPLARLRYLDPDLPLDVSMEALSPFIPPDSAASCTPAVAFTFTVKNTGKKTAEVSLLSSMLNPVGHEPMSKFSGVSYGGFGGNVNEVRHDGGSTAIVMDVEETTPAPERPDILFEDFESGRYDKWRVEGTAFKDHPSEVGEVHHRLHCSGFRGTHLADSGFDWHGEAAGKLTSVPFVIERDRIHFLLGGSNSPGKACMNLRVGGKVIRTVVGDGTNRLFRMNWDVSDVAGKEAVLEIVDDDATKDVHVMVDHIVFSDAVPVAPEEVFRGSMCLATTAAGATHAAQWTSARKLWKDFIADGALEPTTGHPSKAGRTWAGALAVPFSLAPGRSKTVTFFLTWHFPNRMSESRRGAYHLGMAYNNRFGHATEVLDHFVANYEDLHGGTKAFHDALYSTSLPHWLIDLVGSQLAVLPSPTCVWCENDDFGLWEGVNSHWPGLCGCCGINCMHVLNYVMIPGILFPDRERSMRRLQVRYQQGDDGRFLDKCFYGFPPYRPDLDNIDNSCGFPIKVYHDYLWTGDKGALDVFWPEVKRAMQWLMERDLDGDGIPNMRREPGSHKTFHTTYDEWTMYGTSSFIGSYWLAALLAAEQMALIEGEPRTAETYRGLFERARANFDEQLWNGEYYKLFHDTQYDRERLTEYDQCCLSDQIIGQWYSHVLGLGGFLPKEHVDSSFDAVLRYNWYDDYEYESKVTGPRLCLYTHPRGEYRTYNDFKLPDEQDLTHGEIGGHYRNWTGSEISVAAHMMYEGLLREGLTVARGIFDRYDGARANPWMHIECGAYYARGMSSWTLLLAASGHRYDAARGFVAFAPAFTPESFRGFWSGFGGWGTFTQRRRNGRQTERLEVSHGAVELQELAFELPEGTAVRSKTIKVKAGSRTMRGRLAAKGPHVHVLLEERVTLRAGDALELELAFV